MQWQSDAATKPPATAPSTEAASGSAGTDAASARAAFVPMSAVAMAGWMDAVKEFLVAAHEKYPEPSKCRFRIPELIARDELPKFTQDPKSAGTALKKDGRFHKFGRPKGWGLAEGTGQGTSGTEATDSGAVAAKRKANAAPVWRQSDRTSCGYSGEAGNRPPKKSRGGRKWKEGDEKSKKASRLTRFQ